MLDDAGRQIFQFSASARILANFVVEWATPESARRVEAGWIITGRGYLSQYNGDDPAGIWRIPGPATRH